MSRNILPKPMSLLESQHCFPVTLTAHRPPAFLLNRGLIISRLRMCGISPTVPSPPLSVTDRPESGDLLHRPHLEAKPPFYHSPPSGFILRRISFPSLLCFTHPCPQDSPGQPLFQEALPPLKSHSLICLALHLALAVSLHAGLPARSKSRNCCPLGSDR